MNRPTHASLDADLPTPEQLDEAHATDQPGPSPTESEEERTDESARSFATLRNSLRAFRQ